MADNKIMLRINGNEGEPEPTPKQRIPLPDYKNPEARLAYAKAWTQKYGPLMAQRGDTPLRINEIPAWGKGTAKQLSMQAAKNLSLDPALLYSSAMEEGMSGIYPHEIEGKQGMVQSSGDKEYPVSGFINFGLDNFSDAYPALVKKGYLSPDFQTNFKLAKDVNEKNQPINSANFRTPDAALQAKAAMIKSSEDEIGEFAKKSNIELSPKAKAFFTLINYNAGSGNAQEMLKQYYKSGYLKGDKFLEKRPSEYWQQPYENVIRRIKMADALKNEGYFDDENANSAQNQSNNNQKVMLKVSK